MDQKTKEAYELQYKSIETVRNIVDEESLRLGRPLFSCTVSFGCQMETEYAIG